MAISMSGATVDSSERQSLNSKSVDGYGVVSGGEVANTQGTGFLGLGGRETSGAELAGITESFATNVTAKIDNYISEVDAAIEELSSVQNNVAFRGSGIETALNNFVEGCKTVAKSYTNKLKEAEDQIINSVAQAYATQDSDLSSNLGSDQANVEGQGF